VGFTAWDPHTAARQLQAAVDASRRVYEDAEREKREADAALEQSIWDELRAIEPGVDAAVSEMRLAAAEAGLRGYEQIQTNDPMALYELSRRQGDGREFELWAGLSWALGEVSDICQVLRSHPTMGYAHPIGSLPQWSGWLTNARNTVSNIAGVLASWQRLEQAW
jgi:hypothetical protein